jgi:hypothetical protein
MIRGYHLIFCAYGFWLPNDPRGSWSDFVRRWEILHHGHATKVNTRQSLAHTPHDHARRQAAKAALRFPAVQFTGRQAQAIGCGFAKAKATGGDVVYACSILPEHVHLVIARGASTAETSAERFKSFATKALNAQALHPLKGWHDRHMQTPSPWSRGLWKVFLNSDAAIQRAIEYVEANPTKEGKPPQRWSFVDRPF